MSSKCRRRLLEPGRLSEGAKALVQAFAVAASSTFLSTCDLFHHQHHPLLSPSPSTCLSCKFRTTPIHTRHPTRRQTCLAAAALRSTSPASATAHALATLPTSSNGMSSNASPQPDRNRSVVLYHSPRSRVFRVPLRHGRRNHCFATQLPPFLLHPCAPTTICTFRPSTTRSFESNHLTPLKLWPPSPLRHPSPPFGFL
jgi:hypothetical protein